MPWQEQLISGWGSNNGKSIAIETQRFQIKYEEGASFLWTFLPVPSREELVSQGGAQHSTAQQGCGLKVLVTSWGAAALQCALLDNHFLGIVSICGSSNYVDIHIYHWFCWFTLIRTWIIHVHQSSLTNDPQIPYDSIEHWRALIPLLGDCL